MIVEVNGVINLEDGTGCVVCMAYDGGRTDGSIFEDRIGWENDELGRG